MSGPLGAGEGGGPDLQVSGLILEPDSQRKEPINRRQPPSPNSTVLSLELNPSLELNLSLQVNASLLWNLCPSAAMFKLWNLIGQLTDLSATVSAPKDYVLVPKHYAHAYALAFRVRFCEYRENKLKIKYDC